MVWICAVALVFCASLLVRVLIITRLEKRTVAPSWLKHAIAGVMVLAATCLLAATFPADIGR